MIRGSHVLMGSHERGAMAFLPSQHHDGFRRSRFASLLRLDEKAQMVVELAVVTPAILMVALVIVNSLFFTAETARFDHVAPQAVLSVCGSPEGAEFDVEQACGQVAERLRRGRDEGHVRYEVTSLGDGGCEIFSCTVFVRPWPLAEGKSNILGVKIPLELKHMVSMAVDPYVIGSLR